MEIKKNKKKNILIGVCAGIASYKTCELVRLLVKNDFTVKIMMTEPATKFVSPLVFGELSKNPVYLDMFEPKRIDAVEHIALAEWASLCVIVPATANTISKIACGIADNLVTTVICALPKDTKVLIVPAMNENMWKNEIIQENILKLKKLQKYVFLEPTKGELLCGAYGDGRLPQPEDIYKKILKLIHK
ncbi:MAG: hypothetical protein NC918_05450 [Candidatus Omnitrophica bacterium]|nr:hypothetical protein [Candidatus Omnitrophota bacterium]